MKCVINNYINIIKNRHFIARNNNQQKQCNINKRELKSLNKLKSNNTIKIDNSDKNVGPCIIPHNIYDFETYKLLQNNNAFTIVNTHECNIIKFCINKINLTFNLINKFCNINNNRLINKKAQSKIINNAHKCKNIPLMLPIIKLHKPKIKWRELVRLPKNWVTYAIQKTVSFELNIIRFFYFFKV